MIAMKVLPYDLHFENIIYAILSHVYDCTFIKAIEFNQWSWRKETEKKKSILLSEVNLVLSYA